MKLQFIENSKARCIKDGCNNKGVFRLTLATRGERSAYVCEKHCYDANNLESYFAENDYIHGTYKMNGFTYSIELETSDADYKAVFELLNLHFLPTSDSTVYIEFKSPIYDGLNALQKALVSVELLENRGHLSTTETWDYDSIGTHCHVGHKDYINRGTMKYLKEYYNELFLPLSNAMVENADATKALYGRDLSGEWAEPIGMYTDANNHSNFINMQHDNTIEFRTCKFITAKQYMQAVHCNKDMVNCLIENFIKHYNDYDYNRRLYYSIDDYRLHKAQVTAKKLVKLYKKYAGLN